MLVGDRGGRPPFLAAAFLAAAFLATGPTGTPFGFGLAAATGAVACAGGGRTSGAGVGVGGAHAPFFVASSGSGGRRTASLRGWHGVRTQKGRRQTGSRRTTATATMDFEVRVEEEHHRLSSCPIPEFSTMATGDGDGDGAVLVGGAGGDWAVETRDGVVGIGERTAEERGTAEGRATEGRRADGARGVARARDAAIQPLVV